MTRLHALPVAPGRLGTLLSTEDGAPVWPYETPGERALLGRMARLFNHDAIDVRPATTPAPADGCSVVAGFGAGVEPIGLLYAHLTRRRYVRFSTIAAAVADPATEIVLCIADRAPHDLLDELVARRMNGRVGILWARAPDSLRRQALIRSAGAVLAPTPVAHAVSLLATARTAGAARIGGVEFRGAPSGPEDLAVDGVLAVTTHSDGVDALLAEQLTLCALVDLDRESMGDSRPPKCVISGECHRQHMPIDAALASGRLVSPGRIAGRVLVWNTCFGIMGSRATIGDDWGLLPHFLASPAIGCLITLRAIVNTGPGQVAPLVDALHAGMSAGTALQFWFDVTPGSMLRDRAFLFGDPGVVANESSAPSVAQSPDTVPISVATTPAPPLSEGTLLRRFLDDVARFQPELTPEIATCRAAIDTAETVPSRTTVDARRRRSDLQASTLAVLTKTMWSRWSDSWMSRASVQEELSARRCTECGHAVWAARYEPAAGLLPRFYSNCPRCGAIDDRPESGDAVLVSIPNGLRIVSGGPRGDWAGALVSAPVGRDLVSTPWPCDENGVAVPQCAFGCSAHVGPIFRLAIFVEEWQVSIYMRRAFVDSHHTDAGRNVDLRH